MSELKRNIEYLVEAGGFQVHEIVSRNDNHFIEFELVHNAMFDVVDTLRPNIKIELTVCDFSYQCDDQPISTLISQVMSERPEISRFPCVNIVHTAAEKLVSLLRRTAASLRGIDDWADDTLVRHIYDLQVINAAMPLNQEFIELVHKTVQSDGQQFSNRYKTFLEQPELEIKAALLALNTDGVFRQRYDRFLGPLVYAKSKPTFEEGLATINLLAKRVWGKRVLAVTGSSDS